MFEFETFIGSPVVSTYKYISIGIGYISKKCLFYRMLQYCG